MLTRSNVAYNLKISPHVLEIKYSNGKRVLYYFSSDLYKKKFCAKQSENRKTINESLSNRFGFCVECGQLADLKLYTAIEKRGFLIQIDEERVECLENVKLTTPVMEVMK